MHSITSLATCILFFQLIIVSCNGQQIPPKDDTIYGGENNQAEEPKLDFSDILRKFAIKFYKGRFMEGQNLVVAPLLIFNAFMSLYNIADASTKFDIHSMVDIPQWAREEQMFELERLSDSYLRPANTSHSHLSARLYYDSSIGKITRKLKGENLTTVASSFAKKSTFLSHVNGWVKREYPRSTDDLVRDYDVDGETKVFLAGAFSFAWPTHLTPTASEGEFQGEKVTFLEGSGIPTRHAKIDELKIEVVELKHAEMSEIKLWLVLPNEGATVKQFNEKLNVEVISKIEKSLQEKTVTVSVPEVSIEYNSQEDAYVMEVFDVFTSLFTTPSVQLADEKDNFYPIKRFMMKSIFRLAKGDGQGQKSGSPQATVKFDRPFAMMILTKDGDVPLLMANYFSPVDKIRELMELERKFHLLAQQEKHDL